MFECNHAVKAKKGKKWCIGLMSTFTPGLGHFANGQLGKAILTDAAITIGGITAVFGGMAAATKSKALGLATTVLGATIAVGTYLWQIVNSVKNAAANVEIVPATRVEK